MPQGNESTSVFNGRSEQLSDPADHVRKIEKGAGAIPEGPTRALLCGTAGTANLTTAAGDELVNYPLQQGYNPIRVTHVKTGGTAGDIWGLW